MPFNRINGFYVGYFQTPENHLMSLDERNDEINQSLQTSLEQLNAVIEKKEAMLKKMMVARDTIHCFHSYQEENDGQGEYQFLIAMIKQRGGWRLSYCTHYENYGHPDREVQWKPLVDCSIENRLRAASHIDDLRAKIVEEKEKLMPEIADAIKLLASTEE